MNPPRRFRRPRLRLNYHVALVPEEGVYLLSERDPILLPGRVFCRLVPCLDGRTDIDGIVSALADEYPALQVRVALDVLVRGGYLVDEDPESPPASGVPLAIERRSFWEGLGLDASVAEARMAATRVTLRGFGGVALTAFESALEAAGVRVARGPDDAAGVVLAVVADALAPGLEQLNATALASGRPWMLVKPFGSVQWIGPWFAPGETACWECLGQRVRLKRRVEAYLAGRPHQSAASRYTDAAAAASVGVAASLVSLEVARTLAGGGSLAGRILTFDLKERRLEQHVVVRRPQCPACGHPVDPATAARPIEFQSRRKAHTDDGGHRVEAPQATIDRLIHHVSPLCGLVEFLEPEPITAAPELHVVLSGANLSRMAPNNLAGLRRSLRHNSGGKGLSLVQARASALCEALERYSSTFHGEEPRMRASLRELGERALHPNRCMLYSDSQFQSRANWNARAGSDVRHSHVPEPFDDEATIDWTEVYSLTERTHRLLPTAYCYFAAPESTGARFAPADSNGCAAGNTIEEAVLQGFLELVERDAVALWWYNRLRRRRIAIDSFDDPAIVHLLAVYRRLGREVWALDLTSDLGVPVVAALSRRVDGAAERIVLGFGAHLDPRIALVRGLTEMNQMLLAEQQTGPGASGDLADWLASATLAGQPHLVPAALPARAATDFPRLATDDIRDDIEHCRTVVEGKGHSMLVLDLTRPDVGLAVARVFVPGLRHFWPRFAPGRLYDVPVEMGWLDSPTAERDLNPTPFFW